MNPEQKYLLLCYAEDNATPPHASNVATIRIDTFIPQLVLVDIFLGISVSEFTMDKRKEFLDTLNGIFTPWYFRISTVHEHNDLQVTSRQLLQSSAVVEAYALTSDLTEYQSNIDTVKEFVYFQDLVGAMTIDSTGTPTAIITGPEFDTFPIVKVEPTYDVETANSYNWWLDTLEGFITIGILSLLPLIPLIFLMICCCRKYRCCSRLASMCKRCTCTCLKSLCRRSKPQKKKEPSPTPVVAKAVDDQNAKKKAETLIVVPAPLRAPPPEKKVRSYNGGYSSAASLKKQFDAFIGDKKPSQAKTGTQINGSRKLLASGHAFETISNPPASVDHAPKTPIGHRQSVSHGGDSRENSDLFLGNRSWRKISVPSNK
ncbi:uncharacterized protein LOC144353306 [Saccoglossus kowalevskii]